MSGGYKKLGRQLLVGLLFCLPFLVASLFPGAASAQTAPPNREPALALTADEKAWIAAHPVLRMTALKDWPPFEFRNDKGAHVGVAAELIQMVGDRLGLRRRGRHGQENCPP